MKTFKPHQNFFISRLIKPKKKSKFSDKYYQFNLILLTSISLPMLLVALFNIIVDPYGIFNSPIIKGFNQLKPEKLNNTRLFKAIDISRLKPEAVFLGSSRTEYSLDPNHPALKKYNSSYNLALGAATPYELLRYFNHALANQPNLKLVIINIDEFMFNELNKEASNFSENRLEKKHITIQDTIQTTLSFDALIASEENIFASRNNPNYQSYQVNGMLNLRPIDKDISAGQYRLTKSISHYFKTFPEYRLSKKYLNDFKTLIELCRKNKIDFQVYISPSHATRWETIRAAGHWQSYEQMKRELVKITPVWDFSGYNSITTEPINNEMNNYIDDSHYRNNVGNLVLNKLLNYETEKVPKDFGVLVTSENLEKHLLLIRAAREVWAKKHSQEVQLVQNLKNNSQKNH